MTVLANTPVLSVLLWVGVLIAVILVGSLGVFALRRSVLGDPSTGADDAGLMDRMRRMVEGGEMTQDEYDRARRAIVEKARGGHDTARAGPGAVSKGAPGGDDGGGIAPDDRSRGA